MALPETAGRYFVRKLALAVAENDVVVADDDSEMAGGSIQEALEALSARVFALENP